jgi:hypothetical protein
MTANGQILKIRVHTPDHRNFCVFSGRSGLRHKQTLEARVTMARLALESDPWREGAVIHRVQNWLNAHRNKCMALLRAWQPRVYSFLLSSPFWIQMMFNRPAKISVREDYLVFRFFGLGERLVGYAGGANKHARFQTG